MASRLAPEGTDAVVRQLEAERLAPVPRAGHAVAVDAEDVAILLRQVTRRKLTPGARGAYDRLSGLLRSRA